jgi:DNA polymerase (family X)
LRVAVSELPNATIADALEELGDLYELDGAIVHRVLAYRTAAQTVREAPVSVAALAQGGRAIELAGVGKTLQEKILALINTGTIPAAEKLRAKFPPGLIAITRLPGIGPKRARMLHDELGIDSPESLRQAALAQRLRTVRGLGPKLEERVLTAVQASPEGNLELPSQKRLILSKALELAEALVAGLSKHGGQEATVVIAGSARRQVDSVKDIDLVASTDDPGSLTAALPTLEQVESVGSTSRLGARGRTHVGLGFDLRIGPRRSAGNLLQHFTGSAAHNTAIREAAVRHGLHVSEHGIVHEESGKQLCHASEEEVYRALGYAMIEPELRENRGELEAALLAGPTGLPSLIAESDIKGDLHCHTIASDGHNTIDEMANAALARGYEYLAITDHSASHGFGNDVSPAELERQIERVRECNARIGGIELLAGSEVNILPDGSLDYEDDLLAQLDWTIASIHTAFGMDEQKMTSRMIAAIEHPLVDAIGHPTGRLIDRRPPYALDLEAVIEAAGRSRTMLEINANPDRRDLSDSRARAAAQAGVPLLIDSDAHRITTLANMRWGVATARRAWLTVAHVANTRSWPELCKLRKPSRVRST